MKILLTGGGTFGHITPLLAVVSEIKKLASEKGIEKPEFMLITPDRNFTKSIAEAGIKTKLIKAGKLRRYFSLKNFADIFKIPAGVAQSLYYIYEFKPDAVFSKGSFASVPPVVAARILKIPILTHESDIVPGLANKIISFFSKKVFVSYEETRKYFPGKETAVVGNPVREDILGGDREKTGSYFNLQKDIPAVLIFGGSQGAGKLNETVLEILSSILEKSQIIHICGAKNYKNVKSKAENLNLKYPERYKLYPFLKSEMKDAYAIADVVVSRAGASSLWEIMALEKPSIVIPLKISAGDHQAKNAGYFLEKGALVLIKEEDLNGKILKEKLLELLLDEKLKNGIVDNIKSYNLSLGRNAARIIAGEILEFNL